MMSYLLKLPLELLEKILMLLPRSDRTNLYRLFSQAGFRGIMTGLLEKVAEASSDSIVRWEYSCRRAQAEPDENMITSFIVIVNEKKNTLTVLPDPAKSHAKQMWPEDGLLTRLSVVCRWNGREKHLKRHMFIRTFNHEEDEYDSPYQDVMVISVNPEEEIYWKLCDANSIPGDAIVVDKGAQNELVFFGYKTGTEDIRDRIGYVRVGKGLVHHQVNMEMKPSWLQWEEIRWEVSEGFFVLCAREKMFDEPIPVPSNTRNLFS